ncbi:NAD-dependent epimerase/dehydratase family protein [Nitrosopumilus piranensis]|uniref:NAD-dependent epimerase/dehydratase n=1 Tax=Nitrosopumilus piranensis TaxID=1582439 RepID=A0A0C5BT05_9ARCH|nr:SDR family oxidoreductase [Nitrosopumilus piranensis]AJM91269.1 NAD-dependent epimerase/dehydratase [Nitrosopumilus piranensis]
MKKIFITGGAGYVGSVLIPQLLNDGYHIKCLDRFFFGDKFFKNLQNDRLELLKDDIRWFDPSILDDVDVVLDLAALSNDPIGELNPEKTFEINHLGRARVALESKNKGVKQYILASSASIYGKQEKIANETFSVFPLTSYSKANRNAEIDSMKLNDDSFSVTALRFSSIFGVSPRMRFDISVNSMVLDLFQNGKITVRGKNNTRPFIHIKDAVNAYKSILNAKINDISGQIFNVGDNNQNYSMGELAYEIKNALNPKCEVELGDNNDHRSYSLSFDKIHNITGFKVNFSLIDGVKELFDSLQNNTVDTSLKTITLDWYKHIENDIELKKELMINDRIL